MARTRALLTERERKVLAGEVGDVDDRRYVKWEITNRVSEELPRDVEVLARHHPEAFAMLRETVCESE